MQTSHLRCYLVRRPPPKTVWLKVIDPQHLDGPFDTEMVQHTHNLQGQKIILQRRNEELTMLAHSRVGGGGDSLDNLRTLS